MGDWFDNLRTIGMNEKADELSAEAETLWHLVKEEKLPEYQAAIRKLLDIQTKILNDYYGDCPP